MWQIPRSTVHNQLRRSSLTDLPVARKRGPVGAATDEELAFLIRQVIDASPFHGEGYRKIWAKLRFQGVRTSKDRVRLLMRENGLQARPGRRRERRVHDGTITTEKPDQMWGTDITQTLTVEEGIASVCVAIDHCTCECVGIHAAKMANRFEALEPIRQGVCEHFGAFEKNIAEGLLGYYAPTSRFGTPDDFQFFVNHCHVNGIGVLLDWVPAHFPSDDHGLARFDGTALYEHEDPRQGAHPDWGTLVYNYGRNEVSNFLIANALFWLDRYHIDGLRVDAVASMLYLDYSRKEGEWIPNRYGGRENLEAIDFIKQLNETVYARFPGVAMIAEESTSWPGVSRPTYLGGLGFGFKWNMGWMNDALDYVQHEPVHRKYHHDRLTFGLVYAFSENFILSLSHDEVVHGKRSLLDKMPGDVWQKRANLRAFLGFAYGHPGKKLIFMGGEFGQWKEWDAETSLDWHLLEEEAHRELQRFVKDLNALCVREPALYQKDFDPSGFEWIDFHDSEQSVFSFLRRAEDGSFVVVVCNFTPVPRVNYTLGVPEAGAYNELLNSDAGSYGGSNQGNLGRVVAERQPSHGQPCSITLTLPPLSTLLLRPE